MQIREENLHKYITQVEEEIKQLKCDQIHWRKLCAFEYAYKHTRFRLHQTWVSCFGRRFTIVSFDFKEKTKWIPDITYVGKKTKNAPVVEVHDTFELVGIEESGYDLETDFMLEHFYLENKLPLYLLLNILK